MYVTTFYSFKGGVGRTMALVNVAVELAQRGRRVLAVDFDLEAPGLDTFNILRSRKRRPGIVDFVTEYLDTGRAPEVERFIHDSKHVGENGGCLQVMPSGEQHDQYATNFREIDWFDLYERRDGYLLFEDLKAQWEQLLRPDYVLIDSRTGHTDTGGICTRQLPDAVVILFFPNDQNLRGLTKIVQDIRSEAENSRNKKIDLHFVMSNVPDLDDEDRVLRKKIEAFRENLGFGGEPLVLHRYDSLSLLNQVIFAEDRPSSRLAREYREVVDAIVGRNLTDREAALRYIEEAGDRRWDVTYGSSEEIEQRLRKIEESHADDGEVLFALGKLREDDRQRERAEALFGRAMETGWDDPEAYLRRARLRADRNDSAGASEDALRILEAERLAPSLVLAAARLIGASRAVDVAASSAVTSTSAGGRIWIAGELERTPDEVAVAVCLLEPLVEDPTLSAGERESARSQLSSRYLGVGRCGAAVALLRHESHGVGDMEIEDAFNYGMALWGQAGEVVAAPFHRFLELDEEREEREPTPGRTHRVALAYWATGNPAEASQYLGDARAGFPPEGTGDSISAFWTFSYWRYRRVPDSEFLEDLDEIEALIKGDSSRKPRFMTAAKSSSE